MYVARRQRTRGGNPKDGRRAGIRARLRKARRGSLRVVPIAEGTVRVGRMHAQNEHDYHPPDIVHVTEAAGWRWPAGQIFRRSGVGHVRLTNVTPRMVFGAPTEHKPLAPTRNVQIHVDRAVAAGSVFMIPGMPCPLRGLSKSLRVRHWAMVRYPRSRRPWSKRGNIEYAAYRQA